MNSFIRAHDNYLNPPEEPEAVICEDCGEEMEVRDSYNKCVNQFCPAKFEGVAAEMAYQLVWARDEIKSLAAKVKLPEASKGGTCDECGQTGIQGIRCPNCGARRKA